MQRLVGAVRCRIRRRFGLVLSAMHWQLTLPQSQHVKMFAMVWEPAQEALHLHQESEERFRDIASAKDYLLEKLGKAGPWAAREPYPSSGTAMCI